jgi:hypothetical protein
MIVNDGKVEHVLVDESGLKESSAESVSRSCSGRVRRCAGPATSSQVFEVWTMSADSKRAALVLGRQVEHLHLAGPPHERIALRAALRDDVEHVGQLEL